eukprot:s6770_g6.t1
MVWFTRALRPPEGGHTKVQSSTRKRKEIPAIAPDTAAVLAGAQSSFLEVNKVRKTSTQIRSTQIRYYRTVDVLLEWSLQWSLAHFSMSQDWDALLPAYLNELYAQG